MSKLVAFTQSGENSWAVQRICQALGWEFENGASHIEYWISQPDVNGALFDLQHPIEHSEYWVRRFTEMAPLKPRIFLTDDLSKMEELDEGANYTVDAQHIEDLEHILLSLMFGFSSGFSIESAQENPVPRILIVDDNVQLASSIEHVLRGSQPCDVRVVGSGFTAAALIPNFRPDVAIIDLVLSDMDGREVCSFIRRQDGLQNTKIIGVSGYQPADAQADYFDVFLEKPFRMKELTERVRALLQR